ncbi:g7803 [Coccomyxa viridis]|uniref:G7803 protein n=1 Tax=Coccomyxa viridis TaxID=1274662 RepID=A0ABP1FYS5_9CHLO
MSYNKPLWLEFHKQHYYNKERGWFCGICWRNDQDPDKNKLEQRKSYYFVNCPYDDAQYQRSKDSSLRKLLQHLRHDHSKEDFVNSGAADEWVEEEVGKQKKRQRREGQEGQAVEALPGLEVPEGFALESLSDSLQTGDLTTLQALFGPDFDLPGGPAPSDSQPAAELPVNPLQASSGAAECQPNIAESSNDLPVVHQAYLRFQESPPGSQLTAELLVNPLQASSGAAECQLNILEASNDLPMVGAGAVECAPSPEALTCTRSSDNSNTGADNPLPSREGEWTHNQSDTPPVRHPGRVTSPYVSIETAFGMLSVEEGQLLMDTRKLLRKLDDHAATPEYVSIVQLLHLQLKGHADPAPEEHARLSTYMLPPEKLQQLQDHARIAQDSADPQSCGIKVSSRKVLNMR